MSSTQLRETKKQEKMKQTSERFMKKLLDKWQTPSVYEMPFSKNLLHLLGRTNYTVIYWIHLADSDPDNFGIYCIVL